MQVSLNCVFMPTYTFIYVLASYPAAQVRMHAVVT